MRPYHTRWGRGEVEREERGAGEKEVIKATGAGGGAYRSWGWSLHLSVILTASASPRGHVDQRPGGLTSNPNPTEILAAGFTF